MESKYVDCVKFKNILLYKKKYNKLMQKEGKYVGNSRKSADSKHSSQMNNKDK